MFILVSLQRGMDVSDLLGHCRCALPDKNTQTGGLQFGRERRVGGASAYQKKSSNQNAIKNELMQISFEGKRTACFRWPGYTGGITTAKADKEISPCDSIFNFAFSGPQNLK
jgi:hypothetical protein